MKKILILILAVTFFMPAEALCLRPTATQLTREDFSLLGLYDELMERAEIAIRSVCWHALMDNIEERHTNSSTIVSSQIPVSAWYDLIGEGIIADAILDRVVNSSHRIELKGESLTFLRSPGIFRFENLS